MIRGAIMRYYAESEKVGALTDWDISDPTAGGKFFTTYSVGTAAAGLFTVTAKVNAAKCGGGCKDVTMNDVGAVTP